MRAAEPSTRAYYAKFLLLPAALAAAIGLSDTGKQSQNKVSAMPIIGKFLEQNIEAIEELKSTMRDAGVRVAAEIPFIDKLVHDGTSDEELVAKINKSALAKANNLFNVSQGKKELINKIIPDLDLDNTDKFLDTVLDLKAFSDSYHASKTLRNIYSEVQTENETFYLLCDINDLSLANQQLSESANQEKPNIKDAINSFKFGVESFLPRPSSQEEESKAKAIFEKLEQLELQPGQTLIEQFTQAHPNELKTRLDLLAIDTFNQFLSKKQ